MRKLGLLRCHTIYCTLRPGRLEPASTLAALSLHCHLIPPPTFDPSGQSALPVQRCVTNNVGVFWDLSCRPSRAIPVYNAASAIKGASHQFGIVRHMVGYADGNAYAPYPQVFERHLCHVCSKKFPSHDMLVSHLNRIHEPQFRRRMIDIEVARGKRRVKLVANYARNMGRYRQAMRHLWSRRAGYSMADEVKRAGFWVRDVPDEMYEAENAMRNHMLDMIRRRQVQCFVLVTDNPNFIDVLREARLGSLKTITVGQLNEPLKANADTWFSWGGFLFGKARSDAGRIMNRWKDFDILKRLEWTYDPKMERRCFQEKIDNGC